MKNRTIQKVVALALMSMFIFSMSLDAAKLDSNNPCYNSIKKIDDTYKRDKVFKMLMDNSFKYMVQAPTGYMRDGNPWINKSYKDLPPFLEEWCLFLPQAKGSSDDGLKYIQDMDMFSYKNPFAKELLQSTEGKELFNNYMHEYGEFMDTPASKRYVAEWLSDKRIEKEDYNLPNPKARDGGFKSFNDFFARTLKNQDKDRPQTMPERDYIISAPTDCIINSIPQTIVDESTLISTKGNQKLNIKEMLDNSRYYRNFVGGVAVSCVLMPNTYHRYHSPIDGNIVESKIIEDPLLGMNDFPSFVPKNGNVGYYGADFNQFSNYKRGYFIGDTGKYGHVAMVAVGLSNIGSVVFNKKYSDVSRSVPVKRGDELGHFLYGGSLFIMIFEKDHFKSGAIKVRLGNQIGIFDTDRND
jgi:phosphatidylserine decarboxylase